jgi:hypothetical protein
MVDSIRPPRKEAIVLIAVVLLSAALAATTARMVTREVQIYRRHRRKIAGLRQTVIKHFGEKYTDLPHGKHRLKDNPSAHRLCTKHKPCAYKVKHIKGVRATTYIREARADRAYRTGITAGLSSKSDYEPVTEPFDRVRQAA